MDSYHPQQGGRVFTFVCGYMLLHKPTVVQMLSHITKHLSAKEGHHRPPSSVLPAAAHSGVATALPKGTAAKVAAKVAKVEPTATEVQHKAAEKATEATEAVPQQPKLAAAKEPAADPTPTALELAPAAQASEVEGAGNEERGGDWVSHEGDLVDEEEEEALEAEPEVRPRHLEIAKSPSPALLPAASMCSRCSSVWSDRLLTCMHWANRWCYYPSRACGWSRRPR